MVVPRSCHRWRCKPCLILQVVALAAKDRGIVSSADHDAVAVVKANEWGQRLDGEVWNVSSLAGLGEGNDLKIRHVTSGTEADPDQQVVGYFLFAKKFVSISIKGHRNYNTKFTYFEQMIVLKDLFPMGLTKKVLI